MVTPAGRNRGGKWVKSMHGSTLQSFGSPPAITITLPQPALKLVHRAVGTDVVSNGCAQTAFQSPLLVVTRPNPVVGSWPEPSLAIKSQNSVSARLRGPATKPKPLAPLT